MGKGGEERRTRGGREGEGRGQRRGEGKEGKGRGGERRGGEEEFPAVWIYTMMSLDSGRATGLTLLPE